MGKECLDTTFLVIVILIVNPLSFVGYITGLTYAVKDVLKPYLADRDYSLPVECSFVGAINHGTEQCTYKSG